MLFRSHDDFEQPDIFAAPTRRERREHRTSAKMQARFAELGTAPMVQTPDEFWAFAKGETDKWEKVIQSAGIKVD